MEEKERSLICQERQIPPATEVDCVQVNKVFDECLIKNCVISTLTAVAVDPNCITGITCSDFTITVAAPIVPVRRLTDEPGFVRISFPFVINYNVNVSSKLTCEPLVVPGLPITQNVSNVLLYCPKPAAYILTQQGTTEPPAELNNGCITLEFIGECIDIEFAPNPATPLTATDITLAVGYYLIIKCCQQVQLQVLSTGYCVAPICTSPVVNPCDDFDLRPVPSFFPAQKAPF